MWGIALAAVGVTASLTAAAAAAEPSRPAAPSGGECADEMAYYFPDTVGRDPADILAFAQAYTDAEMSPALGYHLRVRYFAHLADLESYVERCAEGGSFLAFACLHAEVALENRHKWGLKIMAFLLDRDGSPTHRIGVVVRRDGGLRSVADLAGRAVLAPAYVGGNPVRFEKKVFGGQLRLDQLAHLEVADSSVSALLGVFYRRADAALASSRVFDVLRERSGNIWKSMAIIHRSEPLPLAVTVSFATTPERDHRIVTERLAEMHLTPTGKRWCDYIRSPGAGFGDWQDLFIDEELGTAATTNP